MPALADISRRYYVHLFKNFANIFRDKKVLARRRGPRVSA